MEVIINNTVLSNFAYVNKLELISSLLGTVYISTEVRQEVLKGIEEGYDFFKRIEDKILLEDKDGWFKQTTISSKEENRSFREFIMNLDYGEASCLAIALHRKWLFLTDDKNARELAQKVGVFISGTLGILKMGVERKLISLEIGNQLLKRMIESNYRSPIRDLTELFKKERNQRRKLVLSVQAM